MCTTTSTISSRATLPGAFTHPHTIHVVKVDPIHPRNLGGAAKGRRGAQYINLIGCCVKDVSASGQPVCAWGGCGLVGRRTTTFHALMQHFFCPAAAAAAKEDLNNGQTKFWRSCAVSASLRADVALHVPSRLERIRLKE
jgi:hypothetical protein